MTTWEAIAREAVRLLVNCDRERVERVIASHLEARSDDPTKAQLWGLLVAEMEKEKAA